MKQKSLEKILAENMLRFGTKNLGETVDKLKMLVEQLGAGDGVGAGVQIPQNVLTAIQGAAASSTAYKNGVVALRNMKVPILCNGSIIDALIYGAIKGNAVMPYFQGGMLLKLIGKKDFSNKIIPLLDALPSDMLLFSDDATVSLNPDPNDTTKVATIGEVTPSMGVGGAEQAGSDYNELITYLNTYNLMNAVESEWRQDGVQQYVIDNSTFVDGYVDMDAGPSLYKNSSLTLYATAAIGKSKAGKAVTTSKFIPVAGDVQKIPIPKDTFPKGVVAVNDTAFKSISDALTGFQQDAKFGKAGWTITGITVNTAASLGEKVSGTIDQFATMTGVSVADLAKAGITAANVADPAGLAAGPAKAGRSGQDFLAITRANNLKSKIETAVPGITVTTNPQLAAGAAEGRFGEVTFTVQGPNKEVSIPAEMVSTGVAGQSQDLGKVFNCYRISSDYRLFDMFRTDVKGIGADEYEKSNQ